MDVSQEKAYAAMQEAGFNNPHEMTLFQWYSRLEYMREKKPKEKM